VNNRFWNLRAATRGMNAENMRRARVDNSTGVLGVRAMKGRYQANIKVRGRQQCLGTFDTKEEAHAAYVSAKRLLHAGNTL
jgi:hypothetical protein